MRQVNLVKSLTRVINITSSPLWGKSVRGFILCLSLAVFGVNEVWGYNESGTGEFQNSVYWALWNLEVSISNGNPKYSSEIPLPTLGSQVVFQARITSGVGKASKDHNVTLEYQLAGSSDWKEGSNATINVKGINKNTYSDLKSYVFANGDKVAKIRFRLNAAGDRNVQVKYYVQMATAAYSETSSIDFGTSLIGSEATTKTFKLLTSNANTSAHNFTISTDAENVSVSPTTITNNAGQYKTTSITLTYSHNAKSDLSGKKLYVKNGSTTYLTIPLSGQTNLKTAEITWNEGTNLMNVDEYLENPASSTNGTLDVKYTSSAPSVIEVLEGGVLHALKYSATPVTVTAYQEESGDWARVEKQQTITVTNKQKQSINWTEKLSFEYSGSSYTYQLNASASTSITYSIATDGGSIASVSGNTLTIKGIGKTTITATAAETDEYVGVSATRKLTVRDPDAACDDPFFEEPNEHSFTAADGGSWETPTFIDEPHTVSFQAYKTMATAVGSLYVYEYVNNSWKEIKEIGVGSLDKNSYKDFGPYELSRGATKVKIGTKAGSYTRYIRNIEVTLSKYLESTTTELNFTAEAGAKAPQQTFDINYSNIQGPISLSCTDTKGVFSFPDEIDAECGDVAKNVPITVDMLAQSSGSVSETLTLTDKKGQTISVTLKATISKLKQSIEWDDETNYKTTDSPVLTAKSSTLREDMPVTYRSGDETIAQVNGSKVTFLKAGDVTIYANQIGNEYYDAAPEVSKAFHVSKVTPTIVTMPTVVNGTITYGSKLSDVALTGGAAKDDKNNAVSGHFEWASPTEIPHGGQQNYTVRFVPGNTNMYTSDAVSTETLAITVNKANQTLTWNVEDPIKIKKEDGNYTLTASSTSGRAITYTLSDPTLGTINGNILTPLRSGDCTITAVCPADNDYNASNPIEKNLLIAGPDEIVWKYKNGDHVWAGQNLNADGNLATAHTPVYFGGDLNYLEENNNTDPKIVYTKMASDDVLVTISATTAGDDYYASVSSSIQVYIDHCYQGLNWDQSFVSYTATAEGYIDETVPLTAVAVDSLNKSTDLPIVYSVNNTAVAEIIGNATEGWSLHIKGAGEAILTASVAQTNIYQGVSETRQIIVRKEGERCGSYALIPTSEKNMNEINENTYTFDVPGETLTFKTRKFTAITLNTDVMVEGWNINSNAWERIDQYKLDFTSKQTKTYTINENIRKVRMTPETTFESDYRYISDLYVTQKEYIRKSINEINERIYINEDFSKVITIDHSDKPYINCVVDNDQLEIVRSGTESDCGKAGTLILTLKNKNNWNTPREIDATITLTTSVGDNIQIPVHIQVELGGTYKFTNAAGDGDWKNLNNWDYGGSTPSSLPQMKNPVEIHQPVRISSNVEVYGLELRNDAQQGTNGSITIAPTGGLTVYNGGVSGLNDKLIIESTQENTGFFRVAPSVVNKWAAMPVAIVEFATKSTLDNGANKDAQWQYFGVAVDGVKFTADYITWLYDWDETKGWVNMKDDQEHDLLPFHGYVITQYGQPTYPFHGPLLMKDVDITLTKTPNGMNGDNIFANSYPAPIDVKNFTEEDFEGNMEKVFYLFNSGSWNQWQQGQDKDNVRANSLDNTPGTYYAIPALSANYLDNSYQTIISPMSGVYVIANQNGAKIHLRYEKHVWNAVSSNMNRPLRAPQKAQGEENNLPLDIIPVDTVNYAARLSHRVVLSVRSAKSGNDRITILERQDDSHFTHDYDNGYDATKFITEGIANIYTNELAGTLAISATNNADSMFIGFNAGEDVNYELYITSVIGDNLELMDMQTGDRIALRDNASYAFSATPNSEDPYRFRIFNTSKTPASPTGWTGPDNKAKIWYDKQTLYISDAAAKSTAAIYTSAGVLLEQVTFNHNTTISTEDMPEGVYTVRVEDSVLKFFVKH